MKTLVVEDEKLIAESLRDVLEGLGYEVVGLAGSAGEAERLINDTRPDVLLIDIRLEGGRDGIELAQAVRKNQPVPIVFLTSHADEATVRRAKALRPEGYLLKPFSRESVFAALEIAVAQADDEETKSQPTSSGRSEPGLAPYRLRRVKEFVHQNYADDLNLDRLAEIVGMSKFHFCRRFRESTGVTPYQYLLEVRIDRAKRLLSGTEDPVGDIAREVGFKSPSQFSRAFRRLSGVSPLKYRRSV